TRPPRARRRRRCGPECAALIRRIHRAAAPAGMGVSRCSGCEWRKDGSEACLGPVCYKQALARQRN
ncbi:hypothetical protein, partial [Allofournierella sp.]|uniref:hypothetical protein n=1 Tax=Allofournierella sp. TaxID=1940256 RepID=UPI003AB7C042